MTIPEIFIYHLLYGHPNAIHISSDGTKVYFLLDGTLMCWNAKEDLDFNNMKRENLKKMVRTYVQEHSNL